MMVSVCMCTYQGEAYIEKQLNSIYEQTRVPDEVIICDDGSVDQTRELIELFIKDHDLTETWHLISNPVNLGFLANFYHACSLCHGDIVFFADQDDIWYLNKIEKMCEAFERMPDAKVVSCKFCLIDSQDKKIRSIAVPVRTGESGELRSIDIESVFRKCEWPAMVLAFRRSWYLAWEEMTKDCRIPHDYLFCARAAEENGFYQLDLELAAHRLHGENVAKEEHKLGVLMKKKRKLEEIEDYLGILEEFQKQEALLTREGRDVLRRKQQVMLERRNSLLSGKMLCVVRDKLKYGHEIRWATFLCDLWIVKQKVNPPAI